MRSESLLGEVLDGKYRVDALLGHGGMGAVYRATHVGTSRQVALKVLLPALTAHDSAVERFRREARMAGQMRHRNIVDVTDFGFAMRGEQRVAYLVMELVPGQTLRAVLDARGQLPLAAAVDVLDQVCSAVSEAHRHGVLHRDLKPENIIVEPAGNGYNVKVLDFGIAKLMEAPSSLHVADSTLAAPEPVDASLTATMTSDGGLETAGIVGADAHVTRPGAVVGTPLYMSPEQWRGGAVDPRTDVYSLGVVAFEVLSGAPPFLGKGASIRVEHTEVPPPPLSARVPGLPHRISVVVAAALSKGPEDRPPSVAAFAASLRAGSETTRSLLRRSLVLTVDHFGVLMARCAPLTLPPAALWLLVLVVYALAHLGVVSPLANAAVAVGAGSVSSLWTNVLVRPVAGLLVPQVTGLLTSAAATRPPTIGEVWRVVRGALPSSLLLIIATATVLGLFAGVVSLTVTVSALALGPEHTSAATMALAPTVAHLTGDVGVALASSLFALVGATVAVERARGLAPLRRSYQLLRPMWHIAFGTQLFYNLLTDGLGTILVQALGGGAAAPPVSENPGSLLAAVLRAPNLVETALVAPVGILMTPFTLVPFALLYIRAREAEGAPVQSVIAST